MVLAHQSFSSFCSRAWPSLIMIRGFGGPEPPIDCSPNSLKCLGATSPRAASAPEHRIKQVFRRLIVPHHARPRRKVLNLRYELDSFEEKIVHKREAKRLCVSWPI